jgi:hypothetical protein
MARGISPHQPGGKALMHMEPTIGTTWIPTSGPAAWNRNFRRTVQQIDEFGLVHFERSDGVCVVSVDQWAAWKNHARAIEV